MPTIDATTIIGKTAEVDIKKGNDRIDEIENQDESTTCGSIYGHTNFFLDDNTWNSARLPFTLIDAEIKRTRSNKSGFYTLYGLCIGETYSITASFVGFKSRSVTVTLTPDEPNEEINFYLERDYDSIITSVQKTHSLEVLLKNQIINKIISLFILF